jgi:hypothetical protein
MFSDLRIVERASPIREIVLRARPPMNRRLAPFAREVASKEVRLPFLSGAVNCLARQATEKDAERSLVCHRSLRENNGCGRCAAMSAFKSAAISRTGSAIRTTSKGLASLAISLKPSGSRRGVSNRSLCFVCRSRVHLLADEAERDI